MNDFVRIYGDACAVNGLSMNHAIIERVAQAFCRAEAQTQTSSLLELRLDCMTCCGGDWEAVAAAFPFLGLGLLTFEDSYLGDVGLRVVCCALSTTALHSSLITNSKELHESATGCWLRSLVLKNTSLRDASPLVNVLVACPRLSFLDISWNSLGACSDGFVVFCRALSVHPHLERVNLASNLLEGYCGSKVLHALSELLVCGGRPEGVLRALYLQENHLGDYFLIKPRLLESRKKGWDSFADDEGAALGSLDGGPYFLNVRKSGAGQGATPPFFSSGTLLGAHPFIEALFLNNTIEELRLEGNGIPDGILEWIEAKLRVNRRTREQHMKEFGARNKDEPNIVLGTQLL